MSFLEDIAASLNSSGVGVYPGTSSTRTIYIGEMPDAPDALVCLYARPGRHPDLRNDARHPELHVEVRAATYSAAQAKMESVRSALIAIQNQELSGRYYMHVYPLGEPCKLEVDGRNRTIFYGNFEVWTES